MSTNASSNSSDDSVISPEISLSHAACFWLILLFDAPSVICSFCLIIHIIIDRTQRLALYSHTILVILIFNVPGQLLDAGLYLFFLRYGFVQPATPIICLFWWLADYGFYAGATLLLTWLAIERHILIFHDRWVASQRGRFFFHYLPLVIIVAYVLLFYIVVIFFLPCENIYDYSAPYCGTGPCYESYAILSLWEFIVHYCAPVILESIVSIGLVVRVQCHKRHLHQSRRWRKQRRMIIQLILVSGPNIALNLPFYTLSIAQLCGLSSASSTQAELWFYFLTYFITFLFPFASLCQFPVLFKQIKKKLCGVMARQPRHTATVGPTTGAIPMIRLM
jgi:hypothetical protein